MYPFPNNCTIYKVITCNSSNCWELKRVRTHKQILNIRAFHIECHIQVSCIMHQASNMVVCYKVIQLNNCIIHLLLHFSRMDSIWLKREHQESQYNVLIGGDKVQELRSSRYCYMSITEWYVTRFCLGTIAQENIWFILSSTWFKIQKLSQIATVPS